MNENTTTPNGRRTRAALLDIPAELDRLRVTPLRNVNNQLETSPFLPDGYLSPAPSPDEMLIQQRGRKRGVRSLDMVDDASTWSLDIEITRSTTIRSAIRTPPKNSLSPNKLGFTLRSTPRKRLRLEHVPLTPEKIDFSDISTPEKFKISSPIKIPQPIKRFKLDKTVESCKGPIDDALKGLSPTQLINMIRTIVNKHPDIEQEIRQDMPVPDLTPLEDNLKCLKMNIFKSLPTSRLTSKTDSHAYSRVAIHLIAFKKSVIEQGKVLVESQNWESVVKYVLLAWQYVRATPIWDNQTHNSQRKQCFKALTNFCLAALKKGLFDRKYLVEVLENLQGMLEDSEDIQSCLNYIEMQL